ncbi:MAG: M20 family metallopeptidase [Verrucomicrobiales bacterium]|nr:M20 family metallopeptidase [Verrucomicrobiales bacterium]
MEDPDLIQTLADLVSIPSINLAYGGTGESEVAAWVEAFFQRAGLTSQRQSVAPGQDNVLVRLAGRDRSRCLVLEAHMDTVSTDGMVTPPFEPRIEGGRMHGRGACDTKAGLATMMHALLAQHRSGRPPAFDVLLAAVVDEEHSFTGVSRLVKDLQASAAIVAEPTQLRLVTASKGVLRWRVHAVGRASHSSKPHLGINAITAMARAVTALDADHQQLATPVHPLLGPATCTISTIHGGEQINFVPERCVIELDRRLLPGEEPDAVMAHCQAVLDAIPGVTAETPPMLADAAFATPVDHAFVSACGSILAELGLDASPCGVPFGSDASKFSRAGIPAIIFGPGSIDRAHAADEYVEIDEVHSAFAFYQRLLSSECAW